MTVAELIDWLKVQDQGAIVEIVEHSSGRGYYDQGGNATTADFDPLQHVEYCDLRDNKFIPLNAPYFNKRTLLLGTIDK